jgi:hypothetical protein
MTELAWVHVPHQLATRDGLSMNDKERINSGRM